MSVPCFPIPLHSSIQQQHRMDLGSKKRCVMVSISHSLQQLFSQFSPRPSSCVCPPVGFCGRRSRFHLLLHDWAATCSVKQQNSRTGQAREFRPSRGPCCALARGVLLLGTVSTDTGRSDIALFPVQTGTCSIASIFVSKSHDIPWDWCSSHSKSNLALALARLNYPAQLSY